MIQFPLASTHRLRHPATRLRLRTARRTEGAIGAQADIFRRPLHRRQVHGLPDSLDVELAKQLDGHLCYHRSSGDHSSRDKLTAESKSKRGGSQNPSTAHPCYVGFSSAEAGDSAMRAPLLESPPQPCRPVWAGRHGTADGEEKRGGFHQPSAQAAISREVPLIRETLAMQRSTRSDACSSEADKRGLEIRAGPAMQSYAICQLPAARLPRARTKPARTG